CKASANSSWLQPESTMDTIATPAQPDPEGTLEVLRSIARGEVIPGEVVHAWLASWGTTNELPPPVAPDPRKLRDKTARTSGSATSTVRRTARSAGCPPS